ncbi:MAG TPA: hypothetical protein PKY35_09200 [Candidatus Hydrogenedentes bacterium]|nr:hypothetical protein [Candidatus Hydrogenedentota bacterium]HOL77193.1 hypothetical protein [Candidatus Hydrogenedentota bacterium]HPO85868.1 hypothetical protein [Candidatus Hydrogenedentota bacterium]
MGGGREKKPVYSEVDVIGRCKQCGGPVTQYDKVTGVMGIFCSETCRERFETFAQRAAALDASKRPRLGLGFRIKTLIGRLIILILAIAVIGAASILFRIPVLAPIFIRILRMVGF